MVDVMMLLGLERSGSDDGDDGDFIVGNGIMDL